MNNPTPEEIIEVAKSGTTGQVKTLSDIRFEKLEKRLADLEAKNAELSKMNEELRSANAELYSYAQSVNTAPSQTQTPTETPIKAAQVVAPAQPDPAELKAKEENMLEAVLRDMGYTRRTASQAQPNIPNDGM